MAELHEAVASHDAKAVRASSVALAHRVQEICSDLGILAACKVASDERNADAIKGLLDLARATLKRCTGEASRLVVDEITESMFAALERLFSQSPHLHEDPCMEVFGTRREDVSEDTGIFSESRLYGHYYGRYGQLAAKVDDVWSALTDSPPSLMDGLMPAWMLMHATYPLTMYRASVFAREQIKRSFAADPAASAAALRAYKLRIDKSKASHAGIIRTQNAANASTTNAEKAELTLDLYRRVIEGQFRPWAWTLLQLRGRVGSRLPELNALREMLLADGHRVLGDAARAILPAARNAAAHEDFVWDEELEKIHIGDATTSVTELEEAISRAYDFMCGCECAIVQCRANDPDLVEAMASEDPPGGSLARNVAVAINMFGTNGLRVKSHTLDRGIFSVYLEEWDLQAVNPGLQALTAASQVLHKVNKFQVRVGVPAVLAADIDRSHLQKNWYVWLRARSRFTEMPLSTFLPANAAVRLAVESPTEAVRAVTWLALNDAMHAFADAAEVSRDPRRFKRLWPHLQARLELIAYSVMVANEIVGTDDEAAAAAQELLKKVALEVAKPVKDVVVSFVIGLGNTIERHWRELGPVPVLPTLDKTPLR
ncbi:hypothetical protein GTW98_19005 [Streptomyces sp. SID8375]|uniref:hypothetical protein n=1 Tax=unclassified Streptomyces TaxID=2593676 RepID=UPI001319CE32|nr:MULTISPECIES: hypothetical protein [unclassified Streptomyces]MYX08866.1 hypothetical protein [Streptomyces sp. SID8375]